MTLKLEQLEWRRLAIRLAWARLRAAVAVRFLPLPRHLAGFSVGTIRASNLFEQVTKRLKVRFSEVDHTLRLEQERARIARDIHDELAHSLTVVVTQAEGTLALSGKGPEQATASLHNIAMVGRVALTDVQQLAERIQDEGPTDARPTIADLPRLVQQTSASGVGVEFATLGTAQNLSGSQELAVYWIVQESALKHGEQPSRWP